MILQGIPFDNFINGEKAVTEKRIFQIKRKICYQQRWSAIMTPFSSSKSHETAIHGNDGLSQQSYKFAPAIFADAIF